MTRALIHKFSSSTTVAAFAVMAIIAGAVVPTVGQTISPSIPNAGLEDGGDAPAHWSIRDCDGAISRLLWDVGNVHQGKRALRVCKENWRGRSELVSDFVKVKSGTQYEVTTWVRLNRRTDADIHLMVSQYRADSDKAQLPNDLGKKPNCVFLLGTQYQTHYREWVGKWRRLQTVFTIRKPNTRVRIHAVVSGESCDVSWDDFTMGPPTKQDEGIRHEPSTNESLPPLKLAKRIVASRKRAEACIEVRRGRPRLIVDGKPMPPCFEDCAEMDKAHIGDFKNAGVRVYVVPLVLGRGVFKTNNGPWLGHNQYDFSGVDDLLWRVLRVDSKGYIILCVVSDPYRRWGDEHPDEVEQNQYRQKAIVEEHLNRWGGTPHGLWERFGPSLVSEPLRQETAEAYRQLVAHLRQSDVGKAVIGYHITGYNDGQWFHWSHNLPDYCPGSQRSFRNWLRRKYDDDVAALRHAWNRPDVTFETAGIPAFDRYGGAGRFMINPKTDRDVIDHNRFYSEGVAETVIYLARAIREATGGKAIVGTYYEDASAATQPHIALGRYLKSNALDYFAGPAAYCFRLPGQVGKARSIFSSTLMHGKLYITEQDWRSWHSVPSTPANNISWGRVQTAKEHNAIVRRESGMMLAYGMGTWWYDMSGGWFHDDGIMAGIAEARRAFQQDLETSGVPRADMAVFISEESDSSLYAPAAATVRLKGVVRQLCELNSSGVPYHLYLLSDLGRMKLPEHRIYLFLNAYHIDPLQMKAIDALRRDGKMLVFYHAPGIAAQRLGVYDADAVERVTGIKVQKVTGITKFGAIPVETASPLLKNTQGYLAPTIDAKSDGAASVPPESSTWPFFRIVDKKATPLATYIENGDVSVAHKQFTNYQVVFAAGCLALSDQFIHNLAKASGAWCAADPGDAVYANENFATIHALGSGHKTLYLARPSKVVDLTTGKVVAERTTTIQLDMPVGETRWFRLLP